MARISREEKEHRVDRVARLIISGARTSECARFCAETWGIGRRQAEQYIHEARAIIRADMSKERADFLAEKLALLDEVTKKAMASNQLSCVVGSCRLSAELAQLL